MENEISAALLLPKGDFNKLKAGALDPDDSLLDGWRAELLGKNLVQWLQERNAVKVVWEGQDCILRMDDSI